MKKRTILSAVVFLAAMAIGINAFAMGMGGGKGGQMGGGGGGMNGLDKALLNPSVQSELGLTDTQIDKIKGIVKDTAKSKIRNQAETQLLQLDLMDLIDQDNPDRGKINSLIEQIGAERVKSQKSMINTMLDVKAILTDEQLEKVQELIAERRKEGRQKRSNKKGGSKGHGGQGGFGNPDQGFPDSQE